MQANGFKFGIKEAILALAAIFLFYGMITSLSLKSRIIAKIGAVEKSSGPEVVFSEVSSADVTDQAETNAISSDENIRKLKESSLAWRPGIGRIGGTVNLVASTDPKTFNLVLNREASSSNYLRYAYDGLIRKNVITNEWEPRIAKKWYPVTEDELTWNFELRRDVKFFDGVGVTADDIVFSYNDIMNNKDIDVGAKQLFIFRAYDIEKKESIEREMKVRKIDDYTVQFEFPFRQYDMLGKATVPIYPKHIMNKYVVNGTFNTTWDVSTDPKKIIGTGLWRPWEYYPGERAVLKRNPDYYRKDAVGTSLPYVDKITFNIIVGTETTLLKFKAGELDAIRFSGEQYPLLYNDQDKYDFTIYSMGPLNVIAYFMFNQNQGKNEDGEYYVAPHKTKWFTNLKFRQAMAHAIDRRIWINNFMNGFGYELATGLPPSAGDNIAPDLKVYDFDLDKSARLLDEIGYIDRDRDGIREDPDGNPIDFVILYKSTDEKRLRPITMFASDLNKIGVIARVRGVQFNTYIDILSKLHTWECEFGSHYCGIEADSVGGSFTTWGDDRSWKLNPHQNSVNPVYDWERDIDRLMTEFSQEFDPEKRKLIGYEMQRIVNRELPKIYTVSSEMLVAIHNKFKNFNPHINFEINIWDTMEYLYIGE